MEQAKKASCQSLSFIVTGEPQGKARPRFCFKTGKAYTPKATKKYEQLIRSYVMMTRYKFCKGVPLEINIKAYYKIPKRVSKSLFVQMLEFLVLPTKKPDADNVIKVVLDALNGVLYEDDAQICDIFFKKRYSENPRVEISIRRINPT